MTNVNAEQFSRRWTFIALTYDPVTDKAYARCNYVHIEMTPQVYSSTVTGDFWFGGPKKFLLDEVFYLSKFSNEQALSTIQNTSKIILREKTLGEL